MRTAAKICLLLVFTACLLLAAILLHGHKEKETWSTLTGLLAVIAAIIATVPALRVLEIQEDAMRPRPTPYFDITSRYSLVQLRVKNLGSGVAYDVQLHWDMHPVDQDGNDVTSLDHISILLPQESVSTMIGISIPTVKEIGARKFEGVCQFKEASGRNIRQKFLCSLDASQKQLTYDSETPKTLRELQNIPKELARIADQLEKDRLGSSD